MPDEKHLTADELALHLAVLLAAYDRDAPIMRGKKAPSPEEREAVRKAYAKWLAERMMASNLRVSLGAPAAHTSYTGPVEGKPPSR